MVIRRTVRAAAGNPLALQELPTSVAAGDTSAHPLAGERIAVGPRLRRAFRARVERLSAPARTALLLIAADDRSDGNTMCQAGLVLGLDTVAWDEAMHSGLLTTRSDGRICLRHQLMGAVVYEEAPTTDRQAVHRALASVLTGENADELRPWHLAAALETSDGPDEEVARLLEESAHRSWARGGCSTAARALRRAAALSPATDDAARRLAHGAKAAWEAGQADVARDMLERAEGLSSEATVTELSDGLRGLIEFAHGHMENAARQLTRDMERVADPGQAFKLGSMALRAAWAAGHGDLRREALQRLERRLSQGDVPNADLLPLLRTWWTDDQRGGVADQDRAVAPGREALARLSGGSWLLMPPAPLAVAWGIEPELGETLHRGIDELRHTDQVTALAQALAQTLTLDVARGSWILAKANGLEGLRVAREIGDEQLASQYRISLGLMAVPRGDEQTVADLAARTIEMSAPRGVRLLSAAAQWTLGMSALFAGRAEEALDLLIRLTEDGHHAAHPTIALLAAPDTAEAAIQAGQPATAEEQARLLRRWAERSHAAWAVSATHLVQALLASGADAEKQFRLALDVPGAPSRAFPYARGETLHRGIDELRHTDQVTALAQALAQTLTLDVARGSWILAKANGLEGLRVAREIGDEQLASQYRISLGLMAVPRGDEQTVADLAARTIEMSAPRGVRLLSAAAQWTLGMSALFAGRAEEALDLLIRLTEDGHHAAHPTIALLAAPDTAEAAIQAGQPATAEEQARLLRRWAERSHAAWAVSATHLVQALLASGADAEKQFRLALDVPGAPSRAFPYARTRLLYGEWLRRNRRRIDARTQLAEAAETFRRLDAAPLLARTRAEQELAGQQPRRDSVPARDARAVLTQQELRVARLAAEGLTNREIGTQLLISPRTVGYHLANVFPKLGIVSRADLARVDFEDGLRLMD